MTDERRLVGVKISWGLGNQLHQYAAGLTLSRRLGAELVLDTSHYRRARPGRELALGALGITWREGRMPPHKPLRQLASRLGMLRDPFRDLPVLKATYDFDPAFRTVETSMLLNGYFQSWRYLEGHEQAVREAFDTSRLASERTVELAAEMRAAEHPVVVHVRRGDYVDSAKSIARYGKLEADYYDRARARIEARVANPTYFLFTDDPEAAMAELPRWPHTRLVTGHTGLDDFYLMSLGRHFIIANSTYSWWAAWLAQGPGKLVVAPATWKGPAIRPIDMDDRLPPEWIRV